MVAEDLDFVAGMLSHPEVMRYYPKCYTREESSRWLARQRERYLTDGHGLWLVLERATGEAVGQVGLLAQLVGGVVETEVGYLIHRPYWRQGVASEAAIACRDHAFEALDRDHVISLIRPENLPSQGVAGKMGMEPFERTMHAGLEHVVYRVNRP